MTRLNPYDQGLDKNDANFVALSPLSYLERAARVYPDRTAIIYGEQRQNWAQTYQRCRRLASALAARGIAPATLAFEASLGRTSMEYYDGFVFSFHAAGDLPPVASGGRYDALTAVLGQGKSIPAVGGVIRPGLVAQLKGAI